jgi:hypothetical protein
VDENSLAIPRKLKVRILLVDSALVPLARNRDTDWIDKLASLGFKSPL